MEYVRSSYPPEEALGGKGAFDKFVEVVKRFDASGKFADVNNLLVPL